MKKKTVIITGGSDGIGAAAAKKLKGLGHNVVIAGRSIEKTKSLADTLEVPYHIADYTKIGDIIRLSHELREYDHIDVLANNTGGAMGKKEITEDGFEKTFQVNVLGGFILTNLLIDKLVRDKASVIQTTSIAANLFSHDFDIDDLNSEKKYDAINAYGNAKLCDVLFTRELDRRYRDKGISAVAFEPGIVRTNFASESTPFLKFAYHSPLKYLFTITPEKSADRLLRLALGSEGKDFEKGEVYSDEKKFKIEFKDPDLSVQKKLWDECEIMMKSSLDKACTR